MYQNRLCPISVVLFVHRYFFIKLLYKNKIRLEVLLKSK